MRVSLVKVLLVLLVAVVGIVTVLPTFVGAERMENWPGFLPREQVVLGLDLQGGSHLLLQVNREDIVEGRIGDIRRDARALLIAADIGSVITTTGETLTVELTDPSQLEEARDVLRELESSVQTSALQVGGTPELAISTQGGNIAIALTEQGISDRMSSLVAQSLEVIRGRIDEVGTTEPVIQRQGDDRILVQVPGFSDSERLKDLISQTARLTFHMVHPSLTADQARAQGLPPGTMIRPSTTGFDELLFEEVTLGGEQLVDAQPSFDGQTGAAVVTFRFNTQGAITFGEVTSRNVNQRFAILLDDEVITAPTIQQPITGGTGQISGQFTPESASDLAVLLRAGALPATLDIIEERTVGPSLGADSIAAGILAGLIATLGVVIFMFVSYGLFGLFANLALLLNITLILATLSALGATLTLPGIAGIVLTIGVAVDSNVIIFERIREEFAAGRTAFQAIESGFKRAMLTVVDANITTLIAAVVLFFLGSGPVQGFAVTLAIGVITTVFTAYTVTQLFVQGWFSRLRPKTLRVNLLDRFLPLEPKLQFMRWRKVALAATLALTVGSLGFWAVNGLNLGIDFTGGTAIELQAQDGEADIADLRERIGALDIGEVQVQEFGTPADVLIRIGVQEGGDAQQQVAVSQVTDLVADEYDVRRSEAVSGTVSGELAFNGAIGVLMAMIAIVIYVWLRFEWQFGVGALVALVHDAVMTLGLYAIFQLEFNLSSIAAILTVIGYSLNDTVVIYDRIRENLVKYKRLSLTEIIDLSLNQTLARTILTGGTTAMALIALVIFGGEVIRSFTIAMAWGVFVGTYSSLFISAPILLLIGVKTRSETEQAAISEGRSDGASV